MYSIRDAGLFFLESFFYPMKYIGITAKETAPNGGGCSNPKAILVGTVANFVGAKIQKLDNTTTQKPKKPQYKKPQAVKELEHIADIDNERKHPHTPPRYLAKAKYRDDTANGLTKCIIDFIRFKGGQAERINTTGIPIDTRRQVTDVLGHSRTIGGIEWRPSGGTQGSADISAVIRGLAVKIEVKIDKDTQSEAQRRYQAAIEAAGGLYYIAKNFTSFVDWYGLTFGKG